MKRLAAAVLLCLAAMPVIAMQDPVEAAPAWVATGGQWDSGPEQGSYRVIVENVGFEHVTCRVWIEWIANAGSERSSRVIARVPFSEVSSGFWSCQAEAEEPVLAGATLTLRAAHAYSYEERVFKAILGVPGKYRMAEQ